MAESAANTVNLGQGGLTCERRHTTPGVHPFDEVEWELRDAVIGDPANPAFEQRGVEFPKSWSQNATNIVAQKYFRGTIGTPERDSSLKQVIDRVADTISDWGVRDGYFVDDDYRTLHCSQASVAELARAFGQSQGFLQAVEDVPGYAAGFGADGAIEPITHPYVDRSGVITMRPNRDGVSFTSERVHALSGTTDSIRWMYMCSAPGCVYRVDVRPEDERLAPQGRGVEPRGAVGDETGVGHVRPRTASFRPRPYVP